MYEPAGPPWTGPQPVISLSVWDITETSSGVIRWPLSAARLISSMDGRSMLAEGKSRLGKSEFIVAVLTVLMIYTVALNIDNGFLYTILPLVAEAVMSA